jgi:hypothetical protein
LNIWFCFMGRMILQTLRVFPSKKKGNFSYCNYVYLYHQYFRFCHALGCSTGDSGRGSCRFGGNNFTSLSVLGYASGPVLWGPLSDVRRKVFLSLSSFFYLRI